MLGFLPGPLKGVLALLLFGVNTVIGCLIVYFLALLKILLPFRNFRLFFSRAIARVAEIWIGVNNQILNFTQEISWEFDLAENLNDQKSYLVLANHQSWVDIIALQRALGGRIPLLRFFIKKQLMWVPFLGPAWWALDFPFMKRYSKDFLQRHPEKQGQDLETVKKSCERFRDLPTSILIFVEGTRFSEEKKRERQSPYQNLLPPKSGGTATVLEAMGDKFSGILDVTIIYPEGRPTFWDLLSGRVSKIMVEAKSRELPPSLAVWNEENKKQNYAELKSLLATYWSEKDKRLHTLSRDFSSQTMGK